MKKMQNKYKNALDEFQRVFYIESYQWDGDREDMSTTGRLTNWF